MSDGRRTDAHGPSHRLREALKQIELAEERLDDEGLVADLQEAEEIIDEVRSEVVEEHE